MNKEKKRISNAKWRSKNPDYDKRRYKNNPKYFRDNALKIREKRVEWFQKYKSTLKCEICGESDPIVLDFHHNDPAEKKYLVSNMVRDGNSLDTIKNEIAKCIVLCCNCHRKIHAKYSE